MELAHSGLESQVLLTIGAAVMMSLVVPLSSFLMLRTRLDSYNAAAMAASYGSISAVTFITAESFLNVLEVGFDGFMVAALALMESPAIVVGVAAGPPQRPATGHQRRPNPRGINFAGVNFSAKPSSTGRSSC